MDHRHEETEKLLRLMREAPPTAPLSYRENGVRPDAPRVTRIVNMHGADRAPACGHEQLAEDYAELVVRHLRLNGRAVDADAQLRRWGPIIWAQRATIVALAIGLVIALRRRRR